MISMFIISQELPNYRQDLENQRIILANDDIQSNFLKFLSQVKNDWKIKSIHYSDNLSFNKINYNNYDVVITSPPKKQWREFLETIQNYPHLKFLIVGLESVLNYQEIFQMLGTNQIYTGHTQFQIDKTKYLWFTNFETNAQFEWKIFTESYYQNPQKYQKSDNQDYILVKKSQEIPFDYQYQMAVPINFLLMWNPKQFSIIEMKSLIINGKKTPLKLIIRNKFPVEKAEQQYDTTQYPMNH